MVLGGAGVTTFLSFILDSNPALVDEPSAKIQTVYEDNSVVSLLPVMRSTSQLQLYIVHFEWIHTYMIYHPVTVEMTFKLPHHIGDVRTSSADWRHL